MVAAESVKCEFCPRTFVPNKPAQRLCSRNCAIVSRNSNGINDGIVKLCPACGLTRPVEEFYKNKGRADGLTCLCWECHTKVTAKTARATKEKAFDKLGRECVHCGFSDIRALQIDHVNSDGGFDRILSPAAFYKKVLDDTTGAFQTLCANCNWIKRHVNGEQRKSSKPKRVAVQSIENTAHKCA